MNHCQNAHPALGVETPRARRSHTTVTTVTPEPDDIDMRAAALDRGRWGLGARWLGQDHQEPLPRCWARRRRLGSLGSLAGGHSLAACRPHWVQVWPRAGGAPPPVQALVALGVALSTVPSGGRRAPAGPAWCSVWCPGRSRPAQSRDTARTGVPRGLSARHSTGAVCFRDCCGHHPRGQTRSVLTTTGGFSPTRMWFSVSRSSSSLISSSLTSSARQRRRPSACPGVCPCHQPQARLGQQGTSNL